MILTQKIICQNICQLRFIASKVIFLYALLLNIYIQYLFLPINALIFTMNAFIGQNAGSSTNPVCWSNTFQQVKNQLFFCIINHHTMKRLISNSNPFILLLLPVVFALIMGISYQSQQKKDYNEGNTVVHATSLFYKGITLVKTVCSIAKEKLW